MDEVLACPSFLVEDFLYTLESIDGAEGKIEDRFLPRDPITGPAGRYSDHDVHVRQAIALDVYHGLSHQARLVLREALSALLGRPIKSGAQARLLLLRAEQDKGPSPTLVGPFVPGDLADDFLADFAGPCCWHREGDTWVLGVLLGTSIQRAEDESVFWWIARTDERENGDVHPWATRRASGIRLPLDHPTCRDHVVRRVLARADVRLVRYRDQPEKLRLAALVAYEHEDVPRAIREAWTAWGALDGWRRGAEVWNDGLLDLLVGDATGFDLRAHHLRLTRTWKDAPEGWPARVEAAIAAMRALQVRGDGT